MKSSINIYQFLVKTLRSHAVSGTQRLWPAKGLLLAALLSGIMAVQAFSQNATISYNSTAQPDGAFTVCGNAETNSLRISNGNSAAMTNTLVTLHFPPGGAYVAGTITGATENNISNLNAPVFSVPDIPASNNANITYQATFGCAVIAFQNGGGLTQETADFSYMLSGVPKTQTGTAPPSTYNVLAASLSIINATNAAVNQNVGTSYNQTVTIRNGGLGCTSTAFLKLGGATTFTYSSPSIGTLSNDTLYFSSANMPGGDGKWCNGEDLVVTYTATINNCLSLSRNLVAGWGCGGSNCQTSTNYSVGATIPNEVPNLGIVASYPLSNTYCLEPDYPALYTITNNGSGPAKNLSFYITTANPSIYEIDWLLASDWEYSTDGGSTWLNPTIANAVPRVGVGAPPGAASYPVCTVTGALYSLNVNIPNLILQPGASVQIRGATHICPITDSLNCTIIATTYGYLNYRINYDNQCGTPVQSGTVPTLGGATPILGGATIVYQSNEVPASIAPNTSEPFNFRVFLNTISGPAPGRYAELEWTLPTGMSFNNIPGNLTILTTTGISKSPLAGYPQIIGNRVVVRFDNVTGPSTTSWDIKIILTNDCSLPAGGAVSIPMVARIVRNPACTPKNWWAINCQTLNTVLLGCIPAPCTAGGFGIDGSRSRIRRSSFGLPDNNNDGLPDATGSIDFSKVFVHRYAEGDTIDFNIKSIVFGGTTPNFSNAGMDVAISSTDWLTAGAAAVTVYDVSTGNNYSCNLAVNLASNNIALSYSSCVPGGFVFEDGDSIITHFQLRAKNKLGVSANPFPASPIVSVIPWGANVTSPTVNDKLSCSHLPYSYLIFPQNVAFIGNNTFNGCSSQAFIGFNLQGQEYSTTIGNGFPYEYKKGMQVDSAIIIVDPNFAIAGPVILTYSKAVGTGVTNYTLPPTAYTVSGNTIRVNLVNLWNTTPNLTTSTAASLVTLRVAVNPLCSAPNTVTQLGTYKAWVASFRTTAVSPPAYGALGNFFTGQSVPASVGGAPGIAFVKPALALSTAIPNVLTNNGTATWQMALNNTNNNTSNNTFIYIQNTGSLTITEVKDLSTNTVIPPNPNGFYQLGTLPGAGSKNIQITATLNQCTIDSISVIGGWGCGEYPTNIAGYACGVTQKLYAQGNPASLDMTFDKLPAAGTVSICTPFTLEAVINSTLVGNLSHETYKVILPTGMNYVSNSVQVLYPVGGSYTVSAYNPTVIPSVNGDTLVFALNNLTGGTGLTGVGDLPHSRVQVKFQVQTVCGFISGKSIHAMVFGESACGDPIPTVAKTSSAINITGALATTQYSITVESPASFSTCGAAKTVTVTVQNTGTASPAVNDSLSINLSNGLSLVAGSVTGLHNGPSPAAPVMYGTTLRWRIPPSVAPGDHMKFTMNLQANSAGCGPNVMDLYATQSISLMCGAGSCNTPVVTGQLVSDTIITCCCPPPTPMCLGDTYTLTAPAGLVSYQWYDNGIPVPGANVQTYLVTTGGSYSYTALDMNGCGVQLYCPVDFQIITPSASVIAGNQTVCSGDNPAAFTETTAAAGSGMLSYQWQSSTVDCLTGFANIAGAMGNTYDPPAGITQTTYYRVVVTNTVEAVSCKDTSNCVTVTVNPAPTANAGPDQSVCLTAGSTTLSANAPSVGTGTWNVVSGPSTSASQFSSTSANNATFTPTGGAGTYTLRWTVSNVPCPASTDDVAITVTPAPTVSAAGPDQSVCLAAGNVTLAANTPSVGTGAWSVVSGPSTLASQFSGTSANNATFTPAGGVGTYTLRWTVSNAPCAASTDDVAITFTAALAPTSAGSDQNVCITAGNVTLSANAPSVGTGAWSVVSGPSTASSQFSSTSANNATFTPTGGAGTYCHVRQVLYQSCCTGFSAIVPFKRFGQHLVEVMNEF